MFWWWLLMRKRHSCVIGLTASNVVSSSSHLRHVSLILAAILWPSGLLSFCVCFLILTHIYGGVVPLGVFHLFRKMVADIIAAKIKHNFSWAIPTWIVPGVFAVH